MVISLSSKQSSRDLARSSNTALPNTSVMGATQGVEVPLDTLLEYSFLNLVAIPCVDGFPELSLSAGEIGAIFGSDLLYLAPSCHKPPERHQERISFHTVRHFDVYCAHSKTRENDPISFHKTSPAAYLKRTKTINADRCKGWLTWGNTIHGKVSHFVLTKRALTPLATKTLRKNFPDNRTCVYDPKLLGGETHNVLSARVIRDLVVIFNYKVGHMILLGQNNLMFGLKCSGR